MGKKATTAKTTVPAKAAAKPSAANQPNGKKKPAAPVKRAAPAAPKRGAKPLAPKTPGFTNEDVALRAYFIAEKRRQIGLPGDEAHDWLEAEGQLLAENGAPKKARRSKASAN